MTTELPAKRRQLEKEGFCVVERVLDESRLQRLRAVTDRMLDARTDAHFEQQRSRGSMISVCEDPSMAKLIADPDLLATFKHVGFPNPKWWSGYVISKPPKSPPLFWHQDWWAWNHDCSYDGTILQLFAMVYLVDTDRHNGCLRVVPKSHLNWHPLHDQLDEAHADSMRHYEDPDHPAFRTVEGERDVPVRAGDLVIGEARLLHAAHANQSDRRRTVITLWYFPQFERLPESIQARVAQTTGPFPAGWMDASCDLIERLLPDYKGTAQPIAWNRTPAARLRQA